MTRAEAYSDGWHIGRQWAECDIRDGARREPVYGYYEQDNLRAWDLGALRGYRDTWARWDAGTLAWEMLELVPVSL